MFGRILIANRGEIALRIIRAARELGVETVCVYSEADIDGPWLELADEKVCIGKGPSIDSYLRVDRIISAAEMTDAEAIHPGYGFLAENAHFAEVCRDCHIEFIGPSPEAMGLLGDKISCKRLAKAAGTPIFPGTDGEIEEIDEAVEIASEIGYPVIVKATAGGGGKGMRIVEDPERFVNLFAAAQAEAKASFSDDGVYLERCIQHPRHVEIQVFGDAEGRVVHLGERECSIQRRHQKLVEEAPSPALSPELRQEMGEAAILAARSIDYVGAGTVEFLLDKDGSFYFLEMNTRIQVEHAVTEVTTGFDLVKEQIRVAAGEALAFPTNGSVNLHQRGHAIEFRVNAEDPDRNFIPGPGKITTFHPPGGPGIRIDTHVYAGYNVPPYYDSLLAKLIVSGATREEAILRARHSLDQFIIEGIPTTLPFLRRILEDDAFLEGDIDTSFVARMLGETDGRIEA